MEGTKLDREIGQLFAQLGAKMLGEKHDSAGTPATTGLLHGPGGLLTLPGIDQDVYSTIIGTRPGLFNQLPTVPSVFEYPLFEVITGIYGGSGAEPDTVCDDAPIGGVMKAGKYTLPFGKYQRQTREIDLLRVGQRNNRADPVDIRMVNRPIGQDPFSPTADGTMSGDILINEMDAVMQERAIEFHRLLSKQIWNGNPANNNGEAYKEMTGLSSLIDVGWKDAETGIALPSLYPDVKNFKFGNVSTTAGDELVRVITMMVHYVKDIAMRTSLDPVRWAFAMRPELFYEITSLWPCAYFTNLCGFDAGGSKVQNIDLGDQIRMRDDMRSNPHLLVDGMKFEVVLDDGITEYTNTTKAGVPNTGYSSDIYLIPMSVMGGRSVTFMEYFQFQNPSVMSALIPGLTLARAVAGGAFMETVKQTNWCIKFQAAIKPRIVMRTPQLAARLLNVVYQPLQHLRDPYPESPYWVNGGETTRSGPSYYRPTV